MRQSFFMGDLPDNIKREIINSLKKGILPRSKEFEGLGLALPEWNVHQWKNWADSNRVELPENFLINAK